jgi:pimeloyl-ACP methyl ester carboxylesterase
MAEPAISFDRHGSGEPLVLLHGLGASRLVWKPQIQALARERDVIALDMPGFGRSPVLPPERVPHPAALAETISEHLAELGIERPHVAGNSLGGWVALEMAKRDRAASACLLSPAGLWRRPLGGRSVNTHGVANLLEPVINLAARAERVRTRLLSSVVGRPENVPAEDGRQMVRDWIEAPGYTSSNEEMRRVRFEGPEQVRVPVTIAWGDRDRLVGPPKEERRPPETRFLVLPGCGHTPNWDDPELIARLLLETSSAPPAAGSSEAVAYG